MGRSKLFASQVEFEKHVKQKANVAHDGSSIFYPRSSSVNSSGNHNILSSTHSDSTAASVVRGDIIVGSGSTPKWTRLAVGATGSYLAGGTEPSWQTLNQAAVAGLTTSDGPTFDHLHITNNIVCSTFNTGAVVIDAVNPYLYFKDSDGASDEKIWDFWAGAAQLDFRAVNDAYGAANSWLIVNRTGYVVDKVKIGTLFNLGQPPAAGSTPTDCISLFAWDYAAGDTRFYVRGESGYSMIFGNQQIIGGTQSGGNLTLYSTSDATKGKIYLGGNSYYDEAARMLYINSASYGLYVNSTPASTNTVADVVYFRRDTTGTAAAGIGGRIGFLLEDASGTAENAASIDWVATDAAHGTESTDLKFYARTQGAAPAEVFRVQGYPQAWKLFSSVGTYTLSGYNLDCPTSFLIDSNPGYIKLFNNSAYYLKLWQSGGLGIHTDAAVTDEVFSVTGKTFVNGKVEINQQGLGAQFLNVYDSTMALTGENQPIFATNATLNNQGYSTYINMMTATRTGTVAASGAFHCLQLNVVDSSTSVLSAANGLLAIFSYVTCNNTGGATSHPDVWGQDIQVHIGASNTSQPNLITGLGVYCVFDATSDYETHNTIYGNCQAIAAYIGDNSNVRPLYGLSTTDPAAAQAVIFDGFGTNMGTVGLRIRDLNTDNCWGIYVEAGNDSANYAMVLKSDNGTTPFLKVRGDGHTILEGPKFVAKATGCDHGMTAYTETDNYFELSPISGGSAGGANLYGFSDTNATALLVAGVIGSDNPTDTLPAVAIDGAKKNGTGGQALGNDETVASFRNYGTQIIDIKGDGRMVFANQYFCSVYLGSAQLNLTDVTPTIVALDTEISGGDPSSDFNTSTYIYTAPVAGLYLVSASIRFNNVIADKDYVASIYVNTGSGLANHFSNFLHSSSAAGTAQLSVPVTGIVKLAAGNEVALYAYVNVGANTVDIYEGSTRTFMQIQLIMAL